jgi:hypothetical protein
MSVIDAIFFTCILLFLSLGAGLALGRLVWRLLMPALGRNKERTTSKERSREDAPIRQWHF